MAIRKIIGKSSIKASYAYLIEKKRDGHEFTEEEVRNIVDSILDAGIANGRAHYGNIL